MGGCWVTVVGLLLVVVWFGWAVVLVYVSGWFGFGDWLRVWYYVLGACWLVRYAFLFLNAVNCAFVGCGFGLCWVLPCLVWTRLLLGFSCVVSDCDWPVVDL